MKKLAVLGMGVCVALAFSSCKSSESAYKKAYEKAISNELAGQQPETPVQEEVTPVVTTTSTTTTTQTEAQPAKVVETTTTGVREEKVTVVSGNQEGLKDYNVVCGSFAGKPNAEALKEFLDGEGYNSVIAFNPDNAMYRVIVATYHDYNSAAAARDAFKAKYPNRKDFQGSWLLYRVK